MDLADLGTAFWVNIVAKIPTVLLALAVLLVGWFVSRAAASLAGKLVRRAAGNPRVKDLVEIKGDFGVDRAVSLGVYYLFMILTLVFFFDVLGATLVTQPLVAMVRELSLAVPSLVKAVLILFGAWVLATVLRGVVIRVLAVKPVSQALIRLGVAEDEDRAAQLIRGSGNLAYYLVLVLFLPAIIGALQLEGLVAPVEGVAMRALAFLPRLAAAAVTALVGYLVARVVRGMVSRFLANAGADGLPERVGMASVFQKTSLSQAVGTVAFILILVPTVISALQSLGVEALTEPAVAMLTLVLAMVPLVIGALVLLAAGIVLARWVGELTTTFVENVNAAQMLVKWGLLRDEGAEPAIARVFGSAAAGVVGFLVVVQVFDLLGLRMLSDLMRDILAYLPNAIVAVLILAVGYVVGQFAGRSLASILEQTAYPVVLASVAKYAVFVLAAAMALEQLGVAQVIVATGFTILLGALGLAAAIAGGLAVGLGGRHVVERWLDRRMD